MSNEPAAQIRYELTLEDLIVYNLFCFRNSPTVRAAQRRNTLLALPMVFLITLGLGAVVPHKSIVEGTLPELLEVVRIHYHPDAKLTA